LAGITQKSATYGTNVPRVLNSASVTITAHPGGMAHVSSTVAKMAELAQKGSHSYPIRNLATRITRNVPSKAPTAELRALYEWVRDNIRYRKDPVGLEWVQSPERTVMEGAGDCDDMSTLLGALAGSLGHPYVFRTVGSAPDSQSHVQLQAFDGKRWVHLDPVLEPTQPTTAPRTDPGMFGAYAVGADHIWDSEGRMLSGPTNSMERSLWLSGLSGVADADDRELWSFNAYFAEVPPYGGRNPPNPGQAAQPDQRYRSKDAPGFRNGKPIDVVLALPKGTIDESRLDGFGKIPYYHPTLGAGFLKKLKKVGKVIKKVHTAPLKLVHKVTHGKKSPIRKLELAAQKVVGKALPFTKPFINAHNKVSNQTYKVMEKTGIIKKGDTLKVNTKGQSIATLAAGAAGSAAGGKANASVKLATGQVLTALKGIKLPAGKLPTLPKAASAAAKAALSAKARILPKAKADAVRRAASTALAVKAKAALAKRATAAAAAAGKGVNVKLKSKYPASARMLWDKQKRVYRVYVPSSTPAATLQQYRSRGGRAQPLAGFAPTISFSLGATASGSRDVVNLRPPAAVAAAQKAVDAVNTFKKNHAGKPPAIRLPAVKAFQLADGSLETDSLYGSNTQAAASYYLQKPAPDCAPGLRTSITWTPPSRPVAAPPAAAVQPKAPAVKPPVTTKPPQKPIVVTGPKLAPGMKPPAGFAEIGNETQSPGLPPVGYKPPSSSAPTVTTAAARPPVVTVQPVSLPSAPAPVLVSSTSATPVSPAIMEEPDEIEPMLPSLPVMHTAPLPQKAPEVIHVDSPLVVDVAPGSPPPVGPLTPVQPMPVQAPPVQVLPPAGTFQTPDGPITYGPATPIKEEKKSGLDDLQWVALIWLYLRTRRNRTAHA
jgi:hypothetical protein